MLKHTPGGSKFSSEEFRSTGSTRSWKMIICHIMRAVAFLIILMTITILLSRQVHVLKTTLDLTDVAQQKLEIQLKELQSELNEDYDVLAGAKSFTQYTSYEPNQGEETYEDTEPNDGDIVTISPIHETNQFEDADTHTSSVGEETVTRSVVHEPNQYEEADEYTTPNDEPIVTKSPIHGTNQYEEGGINTTFMDANLARKSSINESNHFEEAVYTSKDTNIITESSNSEPNHYEKSDEYTTPKGGDIVTKSPIYELNEDEADVYTTSNDMKIFTESTIYESNQDEESDTYNTTQHTDEAMDMLTPMKVEEKTNATEDETTTTCSGCLWYYDPIYKKILDKMILLNCVIVAILILYQLFKLFNLNAIIAQEIVEYPFNDDQIFIINE